MWPRLEEWIQLHSGVSAPQPSYFFMLSLSIAAGCLLFLYCVRRLGLQERAAYTFLILCIPMLFAGSKILFLAQFPHVAKKGVDYWFGGGGSLYGGLLGVVGALLVTAACERVPLLPLLDVSAASMSLGLVITRVGCFLSGCNWGAPTDLPWGVCFPHGSHAFRQHLKQGLVSAHDALALPVHPVQLYESAFGVVLLLAALLLLRRRSREGTTFFSLLPAYLVFRFLTEYLRADQGGLWWGPFTFAQLFSLAGLGVLAGLFLFLRFEKRLPEIEVST